MSFSFSRFDSSDSRQYGFHIIFIFNLLQSLFFLIMFSIDNDDECPDYAYSKKNHNGETENSSNTATIGEILLILSMILLIGKKIFEKYCRNCICSIILIAIFLLFKIIFIPYSIGFMNVEIFKCNIHRTAFIYWSAATSLYYLALFIICLLKDEINLLIYFLIGLSSSVIFFIPAYFHSKDITSAFVCFGLSIMELIFLIGSIYYAQDKDNLGENESLNNLLVIDNYKYFIILILISLIIFALYYFLCCIISSLGSQRTPYYVDRYGNLYDINKNRIY